MAGRVAIGVGVGAQGRGGTPRFICIGGYGKGGYALWGNGYVGGGPCHALVRWVSILNITFIDPKLADWLGFWDNEFVLWWHGQHGAFP